MPSKFNSNWSEDFNIIPLHFLLQPVDFYQRMQKYFNNPSSYLQCFMRKFVNSSVKKLIVRPSKKENLTIEAQYVFTVSSSYKENSKKLELEIRI